MKCDYCGSDVEKEWKFCSRCGSARGVGLNIDDIFSRMHKEMKEVLEGMDRDIEAFDLSPFFKKPQKPHGSGFSIRIVSGTGVKPQVEVKTFGDVDLQKIQKQVEQQLGYKSPAMKPPEAKKPEKVPNMPTPKITEEPKTDVRRIDSQVVVDMDIPGVKQESDIDVTELESSVEVRARAGDKMYFKILTKPEQFRVVEKRFEKGKLHLVFG